jgi:hypothetical protein
MPELELLRRLAPPETTPAPEAETAARAALLAHVQRRRRRPWLLAAPAVAVVAAAVVLVLSGPHGATASAATFLRRAAAAARDLAPTRALGPGQYLYTHSRDAFLSTTADGPHPYSVLVPHDREIWLDLEGKGWLTSSSGKPEWLSERDRQAWIAAGRPNDGGNGSEPIDDRSDPAPMTSVALPDDPNALWAHLETKARGQGNGTYHEMFTLIGDALREAYTTPKQRSALYEVAARLPGVELVGRKADAAGRTGIAVAMRDERNRLRDELIFDPATGVLLGEEETVLAGNWAHYPAGTRIGWAVYLRSDVVDAIRQRPGAR